MRQRRLLVQVGVAAALLGLLALLVNNLAVNLIRTGLGLGFGWLGRPAGFALAETALPYAPSDSYLWALTIGWLNSLKVIAAGWFWRPSWVLLLVQPAAAATDFCAAWPGAMWP